jgi:pectinesterase
MQALPTRPASGLQILVLATLVVALARGVDAQPEAARAGFDLVVAQDGSGDHRTIQAAVDEARAFPYGRVSILVRDGVYSEQVVVPSWNPRVTIVGESEGGVVLTWGSHFAEVDRGRNSTFHTATLRVSGDDFLARNLTVVNSAGPVGQALAIFVDADRAVFEDCQFVGNQDTIYAAGEGSRQLFRGGTVEGTTDFIFGQATAVFENVHVHAKASSYVTAASTPEGVPFGLVFLGGRLTAAPDVDSLYLGRPWRDFAQTVWVGTELDAPVRPEGWDDWGRPETHATVLYAEHATTGRGADPDGRVAWSRPLTEAEAARYTVPTIFDALARPWDPAPEWYRRAIPTPPAP